MTLKILIVNRFSPLLFLLIPFFYKIIILRPNKYIKRFNKRFKFFHILKIYFLENLKTKDNDNLDIKAREELATRLSKKNVNFDIKNFLDNFLDIENSEFFLKKSIFHYLFLLDYFKTIKFFNKKKYIFFNLVENDISKILKIKSILKKNLLLNYFDYLYKIFFLINLKFNYNKSTKNITKNFKIATEVSNFKFFNKKIGEPNFLDLKNTIYYVTEKKNIDGLLKNNSSPVKKISNIIDLRFIKPEIIFWKKFVSSIKRVPNFSSYDPNFFKIFFSQYNSYNNLHLYVKNIEYHLIIESSNDLRLINLEGPLAKFLSKINSSKLISYQTRCPYIFDPLSFFSFYDYFFSWSNFWFNKKNFRAEKIFYGSPFIQKRNFFSNNKSISFFPAEINDSIHCSKKYFLKFFNFAIKLSNKYKNYNFYFKMKYRGQFNANELDYILPTNFKLLDYTDNNEKLILNSNIVVSQSFTSPGFYALGLGIKSIILSHLDISNEKLKNLPIVYQYNEKFFQDFYNYLLNKNLNVFFKTKKKIFSEKDLKKTILNFLNV